MISLRRERMSCTWKPRIWLTRKNYTIFPNSRSVLAASGNNFLLRTFDQIIKARSDHKFDGYRGNGAVADIVRNHSYEQLGQIYRAIADGDAIRAETVTRNYLVGIAAFSGAG